MSNKTIPGAGVQPQSPRLLDQVRDRLRLKHYSLRTESAYVGWIIENYHNG
jgi:hypothetical protein